MNWQKAPLLTRSLLSIVVAALFYVGFNQTLDRNAEKYLEQSFSNALATFALARGMNAIISVAQGTEVAIEPGGVGVVVTPGEILDPVNDLVERFSWAVLAAATALGVQLVFVKLGYSMVAQLLLLIASGVLVVTIWVPRRLKTKPWQRSLLMLSVLIVGVRFLVPLAVLGNEAVYNGVLRVSYDQSYRVLEQVGDEIQGLQHTDVDREAVHDDGVLSSVKRFYLQASDTMNIGQRYKLYEAKVAAAVRHIINLIAIFLLHTIVFPLLLLWLLFKILRRACVGVML